MTTTSPPPVTPPPADPLSLKPRHEQLVSDPLIEILSIHRAMRLEMQAVCDAVHGAKNDTKQLSDAARRFERYAVVFRAHSSAEDDLLLPALELREAQTRGIETTPENDGAHDVETQKLEAAEQAFTKLLAAKPNSADFKRKLASLKLELDGFREFMADHMLEEEEEMLPRLRRAFAHDELLQLTGAVLGRRGADDTVATLEVVVPNLEPLQARHVLATMSAIGPLPVWSPMKATALTKSDANAGRSAASSMDLAARLHHSPREIPTVGASQGAPSSMAMAGVSGVSGPMSSGGVHNPTPAHMVSAPMQPSVSAAYTSGAVSVPALSTTTTTAVRPATSHQDVAHEPQGAASQAASGSCVDCGCAVPGSPTNGVARCGACFHARRSPPQKRPRDDSSATGESLADVASSGASLRTQPGSHDVNPRAAKRQRECAGCGAESKDDAWSLGPNEIMCETCRTQLGADQAQIVHAPGGDGSPTPIDTSSDEPPHVSNRVVVGV